MNSPSVYPVEAESPGALLAARVVLLAVTAGAIVSCFLAAAGGRVRVDRMAPALLVALGVPILFRLRPVIQTICASAFVGGLLGVYAVEAFAAGKASRRVSQRTGTSCVQTSDLITLAGLPTATECGGT